MREKIEDFYEDLAENANKNGVTVNLMSIKGCDCNLENLIILSDRTGGEVNVIDPTEAGFQFSHVLSSESIATNVTVKIKLHQAFEFKNEQAQNLNGNKTMLTKILGNVTEATEITFSYRIKDAEELKEIEGFTLDDLPNIPFQSQIEYSKLDGTKCVRIISKILETSDDAAKINEEANLGIIAVNCAHQATNLVREGKFREAQALSVNNKKFIKNNLKSEKDQKMFKAYKQDMNEMYNQIHEQNNLEEMMDVGGEVDIGKKSKKKKKGFFSKMSDALSSNLNKKSKMNSAGLKM